MCSIIIWTVLKNNIKYRRYKLRVKRKVNWNYIIKKEDKKKKIFLLFYINSILERFRECLFLLIMFIIILLIKC